MLNTSISNNAPAHFSNNNNTSIDPPVKIPVEYATFSPQTQYNEETITSPKLPSTNYNSPAQDHVVDLDEDQNDSETESIDHEQQKDSRALEWSANITTAEIVESKASSTSLVSGAPASSTNPIVIY